MADYYFFTDHDLLQNQDLDDGFGPLLMDRPMEKYRTGSIHQASSDPKAYAICKGRVFIYENVRSGMVSLVLKPSVKEGMPVRGVQYFIYKGIKADSLVDLATGEVLDAGLDLTDKIHETQRFKNQSIDEQKPENDPSPPTEEKPPKEALYIINSLTITDPIDSVFYASHPSYATTEVEAGDSLGIFDSTGFGLQIVCESLGSPTLLGQVLEVDSIVEVYSLSSTAHPYWLHRERNNREAILNFIDPAAFFGGFYDREIQVNTSSGTSAGMDGPTFVDTVLEKFANKAFIYLDIRNEVNHSLDYFENYGSNIRLSADPTPPIQTIDYYRDLWPILRLLESDFQTTLEEGRLSFTLQLPKGTNHSPAGYLTEGIAVDQTVKVKREGGRVPFPILEGRFLELKHTAESLDDSTYATHTDDYTYPVKLHFHTHTYHELSNSFTRPVASYIRLNYDRELTYMEVAAESQGIALHDQWYLDHLFAPFHMEIPFEDNYVPADATNNTPAQGSLLVKVFDVDKYRFYPGMMDCPHAMSIGIAKDAFNVTFFAFPADSASAMAPKPLLLTTQRRDEFSDFRLFLQKQSENAFCRRSHLIHEGQNPLPYTKWQNHIDDPSASNANLKDWIILSLTREEFQQIETQFKDQFDLAYKVYFALKNLDMLHDDLGHAYLKFELVLRGHIEENNELIQHEVSTNLFIYQYAN